MTTLGDTIRTKVVELLVAGGIRPRVYENGEEMAEGLKLSSPWIVYVRKLTAMFSQDPEVDVMYDDDKLLVKVRVENDIKADALAQILPPEVEFGNVRLKVEVVPANSPVTKAQLFRRAFEGNPAVADVLEVNTMFTGDTTFVLFKPVVVQFFNDDLGDYNGICSTLYQEIAKDIFGENGEVFYNTEPLVEGDLKYDITTDVV